MSAVQDPRQFIEEWSKAIVANDVGRMEAFVTADWLLVDRPGIINRRGFHGAVATGVLSHDSMVHEIIEVRELSPDVVVLVTRSRSSGLFQGEPIDADEWTTDVLVRCGDGWRCALTQLTPRQSNVD